MTICEAIDLDKELRRNFGGVSSTLGTRVQLDNVAETTEQEIADTITDYYIGTLGCEQDGKGLEFRKGASSEIIDLTYHPNQIVASIINRNSTSTR